MRTALDHVTNCACLVFIDAWRQMYNCEINVCAIVYAGDMSFSDYRRWIIISVGILFQVSNFNGSIAINTSWLK